MVASGNLGRASRGFCVDDVFGIPNLISQHDCRARGRGNIRRRSAKKRLTLIIIDICSIYRNTTLFDGRPTPIVPKGQP
jgi:hypothetical protein